MSAQLALAELRVAEKRFHNAPTNTNQCLVWAAQGRAAGLGLDVTSQGVCTGGGGLTGGVMTLAEYRAAKQRWWDAENEFTRMRREGITGQELENCIAERDRLQSEFHAAHRAFFDPTNVLQRQPPPPPPPPPPPQPPAPPPCPPSPPPPRAGMKRPRIGFGSGPVSGGANDAVDLTEESDSDTERMPVHVEPDWSQFAAPIGTLRRSPIDLSDPDDEYQLDYEGEDSHLGVMLRQLQGISRLLDEKRSEYFRGMSPELRDEVNRLTDLKDSLRRLYRDALDERHEFRRRRLWKNPEVNNIKPKGESVADDTGLEGMGVRTRS